VSFGSQSHKAPLEELRGQYGRGVFNVIQVALWLHFWLDVSQSRQSQRLCALMFFFWAGILAVEWKQAREQWKRAKDFYEPAPTPTKNPAL